MLTFFLVSLTTLVPATITGTVPPLRIETPHPLIKASVKEARLIRVPSIEDGKGRGRTKRLYVARVAVGRLGLPRDCSLS